MPSDQRIERNGMAHHPCEARAHSHAVQCGVRTTSRQVRWLALALQHTAVGLVLTRNRNEPPHRVISVPVYRVPVVCVLLWLASSAAAQLPRRISIRWDGPVSCARSPAFDAELAARLGPEAANARPLEAEVHIDALRDGSYALTVEVASAGGRATREVELASCAEAQRAALIVIATAVTAAEEPNAAPERATKAPERSWSLRFAFAGDLRALPRESAGPVLGVGVARGEHFRAWADARYLLPRESAPQDGLRARVDLAALGLGVAYVWGPGRFSMGPAVEAEFGALRGRVAGDRADGSRAAPWICGWGGVIAGYARGRVVVGLTVQVGVPVLRPAFALADGATPYRTRSFTGRARLGFSIALGAKKTAGGGQ